MLLGNWSSAENYYRSALKNKPEDYTLLKKIADTYYYRGDLDSAIKYNQHGFVRSPDDYNWPLALAALYYEKGDKKIALEYLDLAILLDEDNSELKEIKQEYEK
jgi:tetratricopeptide (TPR) repeat protein